MNIDFQNQIALVTGGTSGIGRAIIRTLADCGADIAIHFHKNKAFAMQLVAQVQQKGVNAIAVQADVTNRESVFAMQEQIAGKLGAPSICVTNAVAPTFWKTVLETPNEEYLKQNEGSILHNVFIAQAFAPAMIKKNYGRFIGINTEAILMNDPTFSSYVAGKKGMDALMRILARELGPHGITVNQVAPGWTVTEKSEANGTVDDSAYKARVPLGRRPTAQNIADAVAFFASPYAGDTTGCYVPVSGGIVVAGV